MTSTTATKERPILFSGPMVRAILDGKKTQTRRVLKPQPDFSEGGGCWYPTVPISLTGRATGALHYANESHFRRGAPIDFCPYGQAGDRLWVRETWRCFGGREYEYQREQKAIVYAATAELIDSGPWRPSIFMPRWASRLTLEIVSVRVERLKDISHEDAVAEGCYRIEPCEAYPHGNSWGRAGYAALWQSINGKTGPKSWDENPYVWVIEFKKRGSEEA